MRDLPWGVILGVIAAGKVILAVLAWVSWRAYRSECGIVRSRMVGLRGKAVTEVAGEGRVMVMGEYWWARARERIGAGDEVRVVAIDGLTLEVEACTNSIPPRPVSAVATSDEDEA